MVSLVLHFLIYFFFIIFVFILNWLDFIYLNVSFLLFSSVIVFSVVYYCLIFLWGHIFCGPILVWHCCCLIITSSIDNWFSCNNFNISRMDLNKILPQNEDFGWVLGFTLKELWFDGARKNLYGQMAYFFPIWMLIHLSLDFFVIFW